MATRNIYIKLSTLLRGKEGSLKILLITIWLGGFVLIAILSQIKSTSGSIVDTVARFWFPACVFIGVILMAVTNFNPDRDSNDPSINESWTVFMLNIAIIGAIWVWFRGG